MHERWIADRDERGSKCRAFARSSTWRRHLKDPVNLSIGQPHFPVPDGDQGGGQGGHRSGQERLHRHAGHPRAARQDPRRGAARTIPSQADRELFVTSGTSGGLVLALCCTVNPGDEVIVFDPYFVMYPHFITLAGGKSVVVDTYPDFHIDVDRSGPPSRRGPRRSSSTARPIRPASSMPAHVLRNLAVLARERDILLLSDEVYRAFCYDEPFASPPEFNDDVLVFDGFSKAYGMTGWRLGFCHGPRRLIEEMIKLQQFTYVCAPSMVQHAGVAAWIATCPPSSPITSTSAIACVAALKDRYEIAGPGGAFYLFPKAPWGTGTEFVAEAIRNNLLIIPGNTFSKHDTHFRLSYAASDADARTRHRDSAPHRETGLDGAHLTPPSAWARFACRTDTR